MQFSANLGFLWTELQLPDAIRAAADAGFDAVECHWPYAHDPHMVRRVLEETGLPMLGLNTVRGDVQAGESGLCAVPDRRDDARKSIDQALAYGNKIGARNVHVMAGNAAGPQADAAFIENLQYACEAGVKSGITILIEPLNAFDAPDYFLRTAAQARDIIERVAAPNLKLMFDCYHAGRTEGDVAKCLRECRPIVGHIQFASVPDRGPPDHGDIDYAAIFAAIEAMSWKQPLGAEYRPNGRTEDSLDWMKEWR